MIQLHTIDVRIYYEDTDAGGIVYYANYLKFFERSRSDWLRVQAVDHQQLAARRLALVVRNCSADYRRSARLDDLLSIDTCIEDPRKDIRRASIRIQHRARLHGTDELLVSGQVQIACINLDTGRPEALPDDVFERLHEHARSLCQPPGDAG